MSAAQSPLVGEEDLTRLYSAVSRAQVFGFFKGHHGPLEETAWVHVAIHQLAEVEDLAARAVDGELSALGRLQLLWTRAPHWPLRVAPSTVAKPVLQPQGALIVAAAGALLDLAAPSTRHLWAQHAAGYYGQRALSVNHALSAARRMLARDLTAEQFAAAVRTANFLAPHAHAPGAPAAPHAPDAHSESEAVDPLAVALAAAFTPVLDTLRDHRALEPPALLGRLADAIARSTHTGAPEKALRALADRWSAALDEHHQYLRQGTAPSPVPAPDPGPSANRCVEGQPQHGGRWDIAQIRATEVDDACRPAVNLDRASSKVYGQAGAHLIKAQNEWINAKQCYKNADTRKCKREEDHGYNKCTEERDEGYNRCDRQEDQGHEECCDWAPCSWFCDALVWIVHLVCVVWAWVSNIVCVAWTWIKKIVCVAWEYILATVCAIGHLAKAVYHAAAGVGGILVGIGLRTGSGILGKFCAIIGVKPETRIADGLKVVGVHVAMLHTGKVLLFSYDEGVQPVTADDPADFTAIGDSDRALCALWDPRTGTARYVPPRRNLFCAHHAFTEDGRLLVAGGQFPLPGLLKQIFPPKLLAPGADCDVHAFDPVREAWDRLPDMEKGRWYPTCALLPDGRVFVTSGTNGYATEAGLGRGIQNTWQTIDPRTGTLGPATELTFKAIYHLYPFAHVLPSGDLFLHFKRTTMLFNESTTPVFRRKAAGGAGPTTLGNTKHPYSRTGPGPGTCALLPLIPRRDPASGRAVYPAGRVMILGGGGHEKEGEPSVDGETYLLDSYTWATNTAEILDLSAPDPEWQLTTSMKFGRVMPDAILLPTGKVLVVGGGQRGQSGGLLAHFTSSDTDGLPNKGATDPVREPEMFDPETETWELLCPKPIDRLYHTTALLLPDARVIVAGHDGALNMSPFDTSRYEIEIFSPPYLFGPDGGLAPRPVITAAPERISYGEMFSIDTPAAADIASAVLIRQSSLTHQINSDQRFVGLLIENALGGRVSVQAPPSGGVAPPGYYMLFLVNRAGVPSIAHWIRMTRG